MEPITDDHPRKAWCPDIECPSYELIVIVRGAGEHLCTCRTAMRTLAPAARS